MIAEFGTPTNSEIEEGKKTDVFSFTQGYTPTTKAFRVVGHGIADLYTLGLWEIFGTPIEYLADGTPVKIKVEYDENDLVNKTIVFAGDKVLKEINSVG